jgi:transposase
MYKRLADGKYKWPRTGEEVRNITEQQYRWLMEGLAIEQKKVIEKVTPQRI